MMPKCDCNCIEIVQRVGAEMIGHDDISEGGLWAIIYELRGGTGEPGHQHEWYWSEPDGCFLCHHCGADANVTA